MNREQVNVRDKFLLLTECSNLHKPCNIKRKTSSMKQNVKGGPKLSMQDFVRMDPSYTTDIEHLVFPYRKRNPQQVAPISSGDGKTRSRLAEMFALSKHLQQRSTDRESKLRNPAVNRSVDSVLDTRKIPKQQQSASTAGTLGDTARRWKTQTAEEPVRQNSTGAGGGSRSSSSVVDAGMSSARGPNVSVLQLRGSCDTWETNPTSIFSSSMDRPYSSNRNSTSRILTKHQSLGANTTTSQNKWSTYSGFHSGEEVNSTDLFVRGTCNRELSPVRWCDREVDGVYLGRSGWVQVQQRSLDENRRVSYVSNKTATSSLQQPSKRTGIKLAHYHCNSEPGKFPETVRLSEPQRPLYLSLQTKDFVQKSKTPSPRTIIPESFSPPSVTPIISPPPAFQDKTDKSPVRTRTFFGKAPFLPRSNAIEDSDASPPTSPIETRKSIQTATSPVGTNRKPKMLSSPVMEEQHSRPPHSRIPQTKSLENTSSVRRTQFTQRYGDSSSSSSSSMGFRSLDSCVTRTHMPRLSENTDSSIDVYEDADDEDNNSSSLNTSVISSVTVTNADIARQKEKLSPSARAANRTVHHRSQTRRSPAGSDTNRHSRNNSPTSSSTSSCDLPPTRSPSGTMQQIRRPTPLRPNTIKTSIEDTNSQRVRRSRSLQLPEKKPNVPQHRISPQNSENQYKATVKMENVVEKKKRMAASGMPHSLEDENLHREAEIVTEYLYGSRSRAAAQAQIIHNKYNSNSVVREKKSTEAKAASYNGYNALSHRSNEKQKLLQRGSTTPNFASSRSLTTQAVKPTCTSETCDFWPQCTHRTTITGQTQSAMRLSQSYPSHQRSLDSAEATRTSTVLERHYDNTYKYTIPANKISPSSSQPSRKTSPSGSSIYSHDSERKMDPRDRRLSPSRSHKLEASTDSGYDMKGSSPIHLKRLTPTFGTSSNSSSSSDVWLTTSDRTVTKSPRAGRGSGMSTPLEEVALTIPREIILTRPGSAPNQETTVNVIEAQQRSLSLPKSFLSPGNYNTTSGQTSWKRQGTESLRSSPDVRRKGAVLETSHTAPVTPSHEGNRRHSPLHTAARRTKATSTPQLLQPPNSNKKWIERQREMEEIELNPITISKDCEINGRNVNQEGVLQKFRKTFSLRFYKRGSKESGSSDLGETFSEILGEPAEDESVRHVSSETASVAPLDAKEDESTEHKHRFGALIWRTSKERKKMNKATRSAKCNSGDSGIQIEMATSVCGGGAGGDSSESHDTDPPGDEFNSPSAIRRRPPHGKSTSSRPHSDLLNQILIDKFKAELKSRQTHYQVRRTHSDLGGQRLLQWDPRNTYRRLMSTPNRTRPRSPQKKPPDVPEGGVQLRGIPRCGTLRRSLSQPLDIDKLSPLMRTKTTGLRMGGATVLSEDEHDGRGTSEDEMMMSDSESSLVSLGERKKSLELAMDEDVIILAEAVFDHVAIEGEELAFRAGDVIEVLETVNRDWWWGSANGKTGWFPAAFVRLRVSQEDTVEDCLEAMASGRSVPSHLRRRTSISLLSNDQVRTSVVRELVHTERDFVKVLQDVAEGYIAECRKRKDMFTKEQIETIFINLEDILKFQSGFLKDLEGCIDWDAPYKSCVGSCFLKHRSGFKMYSDYCNSHPIATATLQELYQFNNYSKFFEACRLMRGLIEIPLDGYLLTPVQRICKYPLQLAELLKYTKPEHPDHPYIKEALDAMRDVAVLINERKRRMESLEKLAAWQQRVEGWEGEDLIEASSQLIYHGEVIRVTTGMWTTNIMLFLFDHQVVYCKKDILKRSTYVYKGRICLDTSEVIDVPDGKDLHIGVTVRHGIKLYSCVRDKWLLFCCRSSSDKQKWLQAFSEERKLVAQDKNEGLEFPPAARQLARVAARCQRRPPRKPRMGKSYKHGAPYMGSALQLNSGSHHSNSLGRKVGTWFMFGGNRKSRHRHREVS